MVTNWTKISKATGTTYTKVSGGYHLYDDTIDTYDDSQVTYDGLNHMSAWTKISNAPHNDIALAGMFMGVGSLTYHGGEIIPGGSIWISVPKAT